MVSFPVAYIYIYIAKTNAKKKVNTFAYLKSSVTVPTEKKQTSRFGENTIGLSPVTQII